MREKSIFISQLLASKYLPSWRHKQVPIQWFIINILSHHNYKIAEQLGTKWVKSFFIEVTVRLHFLLLFDEGRYVSSGFLKN